MTTRVVTEPPALTASQAQPGVTDEMVAAAEAAVYPRHERGFLLKPLVDPIDMRKALEAAFAAPLLSATGEPVAWRYFLPGADECAFSEKRPPWDDALSKEYQLRPLFASPPSLDARTIEACAEVIDLRADEFEAASEQQLTTEIADLRELASAIRSLAQEKR